MLVAPAVERAARYATTSARPVAPGDLMSVALAPTPANGSGFEAFYQAEFRTVIRFVVMLGSDAHAAKDIAQDAFVQASKCWLTLVRPAHWVRVAAAHLYWKRARKLARRAEVPYGLTWPEQPPGHGPPRPGTKHQDWGQPRQPHGGDSPEECALATDLYRRGLDALSPAQRDVVVLHLAGFSNPEIAHVLGRSVTAVETHKSRGLQRLQAMVKRDEREGAS